MISPNNDEAAVGSSSFISSQMRFYFAIYASILICWTLAIFLHTPPSSDHVYLLSPTISLLRGDFLRSTFAHPAFDPYVFPYLYSLLTAPVVALTHSPIMSPFIVSLLSVAGVCVITYWFLARSRVHVSIPILCVGSMVSNTYFWGGRTEVVATILLIGILPFLQDVSSEQVSLKKILGVSVLVTLSALLHPISGLVGFILVFTIFCSKLDWKSTIRQFAIFSLITSTLLLITYGPVALSDLNYFFNSYTRFLNGQPRASNVLKLFQYLMIAPGALFVFLWVFTVDMRKKNFSSALGQLARETLLFLPVLVFLIFQGTSYYIPLLTAFFIWRIAQYAQRPIPKIVVLVTLFILPFFSHYLPTLQALENPQYGKNVQDSLSVTRDMIKSDDLTMRFWISPSIGMLPMDTNDERLYLFSNLSLKYFPSKVLRAGDVILYTFASERDWVTRFLDTERYDYKVEVLIPVSKGLITADSMFRRRSEGVGLWKVTIFESAN